MFFGFRGPACDKPPKRRHCELSGKDCGMNTAGVHKLRSWLRCQLLPGFLGPSKEAGILPVLTGITGVKLGDALSKQVWQKLA